MKKYNRFYAITLFMLIVTTMGSCQVIGDIFKAGVWVGVLLVIVVVAVILWLVGKSKK